MTIRPASEKSSPMARFDGATLSETLKNIVHSTVRNVMSSPLKGDASDRSYFRVTFATSLVDDPLKSLIVMQLKEPVPDREIDFTRILKFLNAQKLPVPELLHYDSGKGLLYLEDCGSMTLEDWIREHPRDKDAYYRQAVELLARLHHQATKNIDADCPAYHLKFDVEKLMWELDFMLEHYVRGLSKTHLKEREMKTVREHFMSLCKTLAAQEPAFTHRDFHSRNLMVKDGRLILIDFQDARMGPCQYDLASLLRDSYVHLDDAFRNEMIEHFIQLKEKEEARPINRHEFIRIFDWMSIQRNLKAVGTFAYQSVVKGNHRYLEYIPETLGYVKQTLKARPDLRELKETLTQNLPGLASGN
ncbi:MAG: aminoglycoside phosphotransferase [Nitrospinaceae bacterium]|nr:MAG: aminoglycoside phosphotransferase [Nitrospinaceae bacterium]